MKFKLALAQTKHPVDGDVVALVERWVSDAREKGAHMIVFPESLMSRYEVEKAQFLAESQPVDGPFSQAMAQIAREQGMWLVYTMNELNPGGLPFNTAVVVNPQGRQCAAYRKVHLFDSSTTHESERMAAGNALCEPVEAPFGLFSIAICYDLRFPEVARYAALKGTTLMVYPSAWVDGYGKKNQWHALLKARAIENEMFVAGVCRCDEGYVGASVVFAPDGSVRAQADGDEALLVCQLDTDDVARMRDAIPVLDHRREDVYHVK